MQVTGHSLGGTNTNELVSGLAPFVNVPHSQIEKYMQLQSDDTVSELRDIVRKVKKPPLPPVRPVKVPEDSDSQQSRDKSQSSRAKIGSQQAPRLRGPDIDQMLAAHRKDKGITWRSTYASYFGPDSSDADHSVCQSAKKNAMGQGAFKKVWKPDQEDALNKWKQNASEQEVQRLADCCRGVFAVEEREQKSTEYKSRFKPADCPVQRIERDRNRSEVPIGSIYTTDPWELVASAKRTTETRERLREICDKQDSMLKHKVLPSQKMELCYIDRQKMSKLRGSADVSACFSGVAGKATGGSEYRSHFIAHL